MAARFCEDFWGCRGRRPLDPRPMNHCGPNETCDEHWSSCCMRIKAGTGHCSLHGSGWRDTDQRAEAIASRLKGTRHVQVLELYVLHRHLRHGPHDDGRRAIHDELHGQCRNPGCHPGRKPRHRQPSGGVLLSESGDRYEFGERKVGKLVLCRTLECTVSPESLPVLLRRLFEMQGDDNVVDAATSLASDILDDLGIDEYGQCVGREALGLA